MASTLTFKLETVDGTPADPPSFTTVAPLWRAGDTIPLGPRTLRWSMSANPIPTCRRSWSSSRLVTTISDRFRPFSDPFPNRQ